LLGLSEEESVTRRLPDASDHSVRDRGQLRLAFKFVRESLTREPEELRSVHPVPSRNSFEPLEIYVWYRNRCLHGEK